MLPGEERALERCDQSQSTFQISSSSAWFLARHLITQNVLSQDLAFQSNKARGISAEGTWQRAVSNDKRRGGNWDSFQGGGWSRENNQMTFMNNVPDIPLTDPEARHSAKSFTNTTLPHTQFPRPPPFLLCHILTSLLL